MSVISVFHPISRYFPLTNSNYITVDLQHPLLENALRLEASSYYLKFTTFIGWGYELYVFNRTKFILFAVNSFFQTVGFAGAHYYSMSLVTFYQVYQMMIIFMFLAIIYNFQSINVSFGFDVLFSCINLLNSSSFKREMRLFIT